ncbi:unnamed protein product [Linum trigynum]|uniref:Uncharacterized protein n=1 Tax=Linum trigynum TaxID=586398 RepID=A0AAV2FMZ5_9ROSI
MCTLLSPPAGRLPDRLISRRIAPIWLQACLRGTSATLLRTRKSLPSLPQHRWRRGRRAILWWLEQAVVTTLQRSSNDGDSGKSNHDATKLHMFVWSSSNSLVSEADSGGGGARQSPRSRRID